METRLAHAVKHPVLRVARSTPWHRRERLIAAAAVAADAAACRQSSSEPFFPRGRADAGAASTGPARAPWTAGAQPAPEAP